MGSTVNTLWPDTKGYFCSHSPVFPSRSKSTEDTNPHSSWSNNSVILQIDFRLSDVDFIYLAQTIARCVWVSTPTRKAQSWLPVFFNTAVTLKGTLQGTAPTFKPVLSNWREASGSSARKRISLWGSEPPFIRRTICASYCPGVWSSAGFHLTLTSWLEWGGTVPLWGLTSKAGSEHSQS